MSKIQDIPEGRAGSGTTFMIVKALRAGQNPTVKARTNGTEARYFAGEIKVGRDVNRTEGYCQSQCRSPRNPL